MREDVHDVSEAVDFAERILATLHEPIPLSGRELYATTSLGIAIGDHGSSAEQLLRDADAAMYRAKDLGRARIELFSQELQQRVAARLDLETALRQAVERDELELLYQPIVRLADGRVVGAEALLRWHREGHGVVLPSDFIPVAEETGMIVSIGTWALERALTELRALTRVFDAGDWPLLAVNLSALQLRLPSSLEMVRDAIRGVAGRPVDHLAGDHRERADGRHRVVSARDARARASSASSSRSTTSVPAPRRSPASSSSRSTR